MMLNNKLYNDISTTLLLNLHHERPTSTKWRLTCPVDLSSLAVFILEEIRRAITLLAKDIASSAPDGFTGLCFGHYWAIINNISRT